MNAQHILLVEDDLNDVEMTLAALADHDLANNVFVVHDGAEALDYLYCRGEFNTRTGGNPVAVLLDNKMPKVNGLEVLKIMKADARLKMIPVVALTSSREALDLTAFYEHAVNAYVVKPVSYSEFVKAVRQVGVFWTAVNEPPPPHAGADETSIQPVSPKSDAGRNGKVISTGPKEMKNENPIPYPALGG